VVPMSLYYTRRDGSPLTHDEMVQWAWCTDIEFGPHVWNMMGLPGVRMTVIVGPTIPVPEGLPPSLARKEISRQAFRIITANLERLHDEAQWAAAPPSGDDAVADRGERASASLGA
jgi:hypothetical protein